MAALTRERIGGGIEVLRLDRPEVRNAMDSAMLAELDAGLTELAADETGGSDSRASRGRAGRREGCAGRRGKKTRAHPRGGLRRLKRLFREYEGTEPRVARENEEIVDVQRTGGGLPYGGVKR